MDPRSPLSPPPAPVQAPQLEVGNMWLSIGGGLIRSAITTLGAGLVTQGLLTDTELNNVAGGVILLLGISWNVYAKYRAAKALAVAKASMPVTPAAPEIGA